MTKGRALSYIKFFKGDDGRFYSGSFYVCRNTTHKSFRRWWLVNNCSYNFKGFDCSKFAYVNLGKLILPKEFVGKKIMFKVEFVE